ncbi:MAG: relaxase/mobilization nuclease domain-containing protein [Candidatus Polarisedimenticolaceae bacterium]|nr:relaxase/mobilization nuclease domain-containing protein [Candidatus Polarisedimenticolaceae bacterium]
MILHGNQRGGAKDLALHLLKEENEHAELHELRGFVSDNLMGALNEAYAVSRGTRAKQFLYSLSLNPPPEKNVSTESFEDAIERIEKKLGLTDQPRAIVFHEKKGRRHCHAIWSRIKIDEMKAVQMSFDHKKLIAISRELYLEHGWQMPRGLMNSKERDPRNFTHLQWQQAKRIGKDPREIKRSFQDCWAVSDSQTAFQQALKERGYTLAKGDRRSFVALNYKCEVFSVAKWVGIKAKEVRSRLTSQTSLPSVDEAKTQIAHDMAQHLGTLKNQQHTAIDTRISEIEHKRIRMVQKHRAERATLQKTQYQRQIDETRLRQERFNKGLRGFLDRFTGHHRKIKQLNEQEAGQSRNRDQKEKDTLIFAQCDHRRVLQDRIKRLEKLSEKRDFSLIQDIGQYHEVNKGKHKAINFVHDKKNRIPNGLDREM